MQGWGTSPHPIFILSSNHFSFIWLHPTWSNFVSFDPSWSDLSWFDLVWSSFIQFDPIWSNNVIKSTLIWFEPFWINLNQTINLNYLDPIWNNLNQYDPTWSGLIQFEPILSDKVPNFLIIFHRGILIFPAHFYFLSTSTLFPRCSHIAGVGDCLYSCLSSENLSFFSCMFLNPYIFFQFEC